MQYFKKYQSWMILLAVYFNSEHERLVGQSYIVSIVPTFVIELSLQQAEWSTLFLIRVLKSQIVLLFFFCSRVILIHSFLQHQDAQKCILSKLSWNNWYKKMLSRWQMWLESVHLSLSHSDLIVLTWWNPTSPFSEPHKSSWDVEMGDRTKWASKFVDFRKEKEQRGEKQEQWKSSGTDIISH